MKKAFSISALFLIIQSVFSISYGETFKKDSLLIFVGDVSSVTLLKEGGLNIIEHDDIKSDNQNNDLLVVDKVVIIKNLFSIESNISKILFGKYKNKSIKFKMYDEFDDPMIKNYNHALFIVKKDKDNNWNQVGWLYYDVYETTKGDWIIPYLSFNGDKDFFENNKQLIELKEGEYINKSSFIDTVINDKELSKYYQIEGEKAIPKYGISVDDFWKYFSKERIPKIQALK